MNNCIYIPVVLKHFSEVTHNLVGDVFEHELHHTQDIHFLKADGMCVYYYSKVQKVSRLSEVFIVYDINFQKKPPQQIYIYLFS